MFSVLIAVIYLAFVSLGLPDSLLGSAWPVMHLDLGAAVSSVGIVSFIITASTIVSALLSDRLARRLGTGRVVAISVLMTASSMLMFSFSTRFWMLCVFAVPYGLGAGAIDACLNNYVALHLSSRHMSWLHCCWGIGATLSPYIMGFCLTRESGWHGGYRAVSAVQFCLALVMFLALPVWKKNGGEKAEESSSGSGPLTLPRILRLPGAAFVFVGFMCYCAIEMIPIVWASTYFRTVYSLEPERAAFYASLFYIGMTVSRALCGFIADRLSDRALIRYGSVFVILSTLLICIPFRSSAPAVAGFVLVGIGCGPIYPSIVHATPANFGNENSGGVIGVQMAFAYLGMTLSPVVFGKLAEHTTVRILPFAITALAALVLILTECMNRSVDRARPKQERSF